jgi:hypothetical protein
MKWLAKRSHFDNRFFGEIERENRIYLSFLLGADIELRNTSERLLDFEVSL